MVVLPWLEWYGLVWKLGLEWCATNGNLPYPGWNGLVWYVHRGDRANLASAWGQSEASH